MDVFKRPPIKGGLVITRKLGESVLIDGRLVVTVSKVQGNTVKLQFKGDRTVRVDRLECQGGSDGAEDAQDEVQS